MYLKSIIALRIDHKTSEENRNVVLFCNTVEAIVKRYKKYLANRCALTGSVLSLWKSCCIFGDWSADWMDGVDKIFFIFSSSSFDGDEFAVVVDAFVVFDGFNVSFSSLLWACFKNI